MNNGNTLAPGIVSSPSNNAVSAQLMYKVLMGSNPGEELAFMRAVFCSMYVLNRVSSGMMFNGGWSGLCCKTMLVLDPILHLPQCPGLIRLSTLPYG